MERIENLKLDLQVWYDDFMWKYSEDRKELAHNRLKAHEQAMKEGKNSPYTHPEEFDNFF